MQRTIALDFAHLNNKNVDIKQHWKLQMHKSLLLLSLFMSTSSLAETTDTATTCEHSCSELVYIDGSAHIIAKDSTGSVLRIVPLNIKKGETLKPINTQVQHSQSADVHEGSGTLKGSYEVKSKGNLYQTDTHIVHVSTVKFYDAHGDLLDVQVNRNAIPHNHKDPSK